MKPVHVLLLAAGQSTRLKTPIQKPFLMWKNQSILKHSLDVILKLKQLKQVVVVLPEGSALPPDIAPSSLIKTTYGKVTRAESMAAGLEALEEAEPSDTVLVHDAARPLLTLALLNQVIETTEQKGSAVPVLPVVDTLKQVQNNQILKTCNREVYKLAQTPQGARLGLLEKAIRHLGADLARVTDESMLLESINEPVFWIDGDPRNIKITHPHDLLMLDFLASTKSS